MRALIQRVLSAYVEVDNKEVGRCGRGLLIYIGVHHTDEFSNAENVAKKIVGLRIFEDENRKMNLSLKDTTLSSIKNPIAEILVISNFTLWGQVEKGYRPSFMDSANFEKAKQLFDFFIECLTKHELRVSIGQFGANMKVHSIADGPVNLVLDL